MNIVEINENNKAIGIKYNIPMDYIKKENELFCEESVIGKIYKNGVWQEDPQEIAEQIKQNRIAELKETITNKNYLGDDVTAERTELRALLGL